MLCLPRCLLVAFLPASLFMLTACGDRENPAAPPLPNETGHLLSASGSGGYGSPSGQRMLLGAYRLTIDQVGEVSIVPLRRAHAHFDVTKAVLPPKCTDCFRAQVLDVQDTIWTILFTLKNGTGLTGYDIRATILDMGEISLVSDADSYTECFADPDDPTPWNPFFIFDSGIGQNVWPPTASGSREILFDRPQGTFFSTIDFVIDASYPENQEDPTRIYELQLSNPILYSDGSSYTDLTCQISDWQDDIISATVDLSPLGGSSEVNLGQAVDGTWFLNGIVCSPSCELGEKTLWATAESGGMSIYNFTTCTVVEAPPPEPAIWTVMVYLHAANLPDEEDINELEMSGSLKDKLNIIVLWDKPEPTDEDVILKVLHDSSGYNLDLVSVELDDEGAVVPPGGLDMADPATLEAFLLWTMEHFPAHHYLLDLWDHGSGIFIEPKDRVPFRNVCGGLSLWDIRDACKTALDSQELVDKIDIIGFDVCILGWIETAYCLRDVADVVIASENSEPGPGWDYGPPFTNLRTNINTYTAEELAWDIVEYYIISYTDPDHPYHYQSDHCTQAASSVDLLLNTTVPALNDFATAAMNHLPEYKDYFEECLDSTSYWGWDVSDIGHFAHEVSQHSMIPEEVRLAAGHLEDAVETAMIHHAHNDGVPDEESGWTIWFPDNIAEQPDNYTTEYLEPGYLEFCETLWDEFLYAYANELPVVYGWLLIEDVEFSDDVGGNGNGVLEPDEIIDVTLTVRNTGDSTATNVHGTLKSQAGYESIYEILDSEADFPDISADQTATNSSPFRIHIMPDCPSGQLAVARVDLICDQSESTNLPINFAVNPGDILVLDLDSNGTSAPGIVAAIEANGYTADRMTCDMDEAPFDLYQAVFVTLGMWDWYDAYYPDEDDYDAVEAYLLGGGKMYVESGDLWYLYPWFGLPDFGPMFGIDAFEESWDDVTDVAGKSGTFLDGLEFNYWGDASYADMLTALAGADVVMSSVTPNFDVMVAYDEGTYRTVGASVEFGCLQDGDAPNTKAELMQRLLEFLGM